MVNFSSWTTDKNLKKCIKEWYKYYIKQFKSDEKIVIDKIMNEVTFYDYITLLKIKNEYFDNLFKIYVTLCKPIICSTIKDNKAHNSYSFISDFKSKSMNFEVNVNKISLDDYEEIIIVDDYSGSGDSIIKTINRIIGRNKSIKIIVFPMICTQFAKNNLSDYLKIKLPYINSEVYTFITRDIHYISEEKILDDYEKSIFENFSTELCKVRSEFLYGYNNCEDLLSMHYFTPNNTLGFLWWFENDNYESFFGRNDNNNFYLSMNKFGNDVKKIIKLSISRCKKTEDKKKKTLLILLLLGYSKKLSSFYLRIPPKECNEYIESFVSKKYLDKTNFNNPGENINKYLDYSKILLFLSMRKSEIEISKMVINLNSLCDI